MSRLANLPTPDEVAAEERIRKGPTGACDVYGPGDLDDWRQVERLRLGTSWAQAQRRVDDILKPATLINNDKFRYHWKRRCWHWTEDQKRATL